jgi:hypothetical protein
MKYEGNFFSPVRLIGKLRLVSAAVLIGLLCIWLVPERVGHSDSSVSTSPMAGSATHSMPALSGQEAIDHLKQQGTYGSLQEAMAAARYEAQWQTSPKLQDLGAAYELKNAANGLLAYVNTDGLQVTSLSDDQTKPWRLGLKLEAFGYGEALSAIQAGEVKAQGNRVSIQKSAIRNPQSAIEEWFVNTARGIEHGFDIAAPPSKGKEGEAMRLRFAVTGDLAASVNGEGNGAAFTRAAGSVLLAYNKLFVVDAKGRTLEARMKLEGRGLVIEVEVAEAEYPITIDPLLTEQQKLTAFDGAANDSFGFAVAISDDTVVVGAYQDDVGANADQGSAYVFVRSGLGWILQAKLTANDGEAFDEFGYSVAISGDTIISGAENDIFTGHNSQGSVYVFVRSGTTWSQQAKLTAPDGVDGDRLGASLAITGDTVVVGASLDDVTFTDQGSAYVFVRSGTTWSQQAKLTASDGAANDFFGQSVAISGDTVVAGAYGHGFAGATFVFVRNATTWSQQQELVAGFINDKFGSSVAVSGDTIVVGSIFGANLSYVFLRFGTAWAQEKELQRSDGAADDKFGVSVAVSGGIAVVGAPSNDVGANPNQGAAYVFDLRAENFHIKASDGATGDQFGQSVAISGDTVVVGAPFDNVGANGDQGSAYVFVRSGATWTQQQQLFGSDGAASDHFGFAVAISGDTVVIGASNDNVSTNEGQGSAYVFVRSGTVWSQQQKLTASDGASSDQFGFAVAISGDTLICGAVTDTVGGNASQGSAYVFVRSGTTWSQQQKLTASDGAGGDFFGYSVGISGGTVIVGAPQDDVSFFSDQGSAYVFVRSGTTWTEQQHLVASDGLVGDQFGFSVGISGDTVVAGAVHDVIGSNQDQGSAYIFVRTGVTWSQQQKIFAADGQSFDQLGVSVAINGDTVVLGAQADEEIPSIPDHGTASLYERSGTTWTFRQKFHASDAGDTDLFGFSVAVSGNTILVGAYRDDVGGNSDQGSAYIFIEGANTAPVIAASGSITRQQGSPAAASTIATVFDGEDPIGSLTVSVASAPQGISITNLTNTNGAITASIAAACSAALGNNIVILQATDSDGAVGSVELLVNVTANTPPAVGTFANSSVTVLGSTTVTPTAPPMDNGTVTSYIASSPTFTGILTTNPNTGAITISNAKPGGTHNINVTMVDNCGAAYFSVAFALTVNCQSITVNPSTIPGGTAGSAYSQVFTQTGGNGTVTFSLSGTLPTGMTFTAGTATLSGTPTQVGSFPITVTATDVNLCSGSRNYTLSIGAMSLIWNGATSPDWHTASNWTPNAVPTSFHDVSIPTSGVVNQPVIANASSSIHAMTLQTGRILSIGSSRQLLVSSSISNAGSITGSGSLFVDGATFTQNGSVSVSSVDFDSGTHTLSGSGAFPAGIITVLNGALLTLTGDLSLSVMVINNGGAVDLSNRTLTLTGAGTSIFNSGSFTATGSTIIYQGDVAQVVTPNISYTNLTVNNPSGLSLAGDTTVAGILDLQKDLTTGSYKLIMPASGSSTGTADVIGNVRRTGFVTAGAALSFGNPFNSIRVNSGTPPTDITINLVKLAPFGFANTVGRTLTVSSNGGSGFSVTMRLRYTDPEAGGLDESSFELWRDTGMGWVSPSGTATRNTVQNWAEESGITQFSPWTIAGNAGPICGVLAPNSQFFTVQGSESGIMLTALANCGWTAFSNASWLEVTSNPSGAGSDVITFLVRDNFAPVPRMGTLTIAGQQFTVVQDSEAAPDCVFAIAPTSIAFNATGGVGSIDVITEERCAWQSVSSASWITVTSTCCGIGNGTVTFSVASNSNRSGRAGTITIAGKTFAVKQKGQ